MADYKNTYELDKELEELNAIYEQKLKNKSGISQKKAKLSETEKKEKTPKNKKLKNENPSAALCHKINIGVCAAVFAVTAVCLLVLPRPTVSESEKRELAKWPQFSWESYFSGEYTAAISNFFNDTVPFRDEFKQMGASFRNLFGFSLDGVSFSGTITEIEDNTSKTEVTTQSTKPILIVTPSASQSGTPTESKPSADTDAPAQTTSPSEFATPSDPDAQVLYSQGTQVVYTSGDTLYGANLYAGDREYAADFAASLENLADSVDADVYFMPALTQNTFITPKELNKGVYTELSDTKYLCNLLSSDIKVIDTLEALAPHIDEDIFFLRDSHWQQLGAYYAAESFAKAANVTYAPLDSYREEQRDCLGSVYRLTRYEGLMYEGETFTYYVPQNDYSVDYYDVNYAYQFNYPLMPEVDYNEMAFYSLYMVADTYIKHITTDADNDRVLLVLKDDYPSAMIPCLTASFEEIYVVDVRYSKIDVSDFCASKGVTDVLVGMTTANALGDVGAYVGKIS